MKKIIIALVAVIVVLVILLIGSNNKDTQQTNNNQQTQQTVQNVGRGFEDPDELFKACIKTMVEGNSDDLMKYMSKTMIENMAEDNYTTKQTIENALSKWHKDIQDDYNSHCEIIFSSHPMVSWRIRALEYEDSHFSDEMYEKLPFKVAGYDCYEAYKRDCYVRVYDCWVSGTDDIGWAHDSGAYNFSLSLIEIDDLWYLICVYNE